MEEILRLEKEIEKLQQQKEDHMSIICENTRNEINRQREEEIQRLEKEASRVAQEFLELLDFGNLDESVQNLERSLSSEGTLNIDCSLVAPLAEEEVDEGFHADDEGRPTSSLVVLNQHGTRNSNNYSEEVADTSLSLLHSEVGEVVPAPEQPVERSTSLKEQRALSDPAESIYSTVSDTQRSNSREVGEPIYTSPPDVESDYDHEEFDGCGDAGSTSAEPLNGEEGLRHSHGTSLDSNRGSLDSFLESEEEVDVYIDTDEEFCNGRVTLFNGTGPPYFHSYLYMKGGLMNPWRRRWCVLKNEAFMWFRKRH